MLGSTLNPDPAPDPYLCCPVRVNSISGSSHIYVSPSDHVCVGGSTLYLDPAPDPYFYRWSFGIPTTLCYLQNWMFCPHNSLPSGHIWKIHSQAGIVFSRQSFWGPTYLCYFQNWMFCPRTLFHIVRFEKFLHKQGSIFEVIVLSTKMTILSSKLNILSHNPAPDAYLCCTFAGSIPSLASVPSISHLISYGGATPSAAPYLGCNFLTLI